MPTQKPDSGWRDLSQVPLQGHPGVQRTTQRVERDFPPFQAFSRDADSPNRRAIIVETASPPGISDHIDGMSGSAVIADDRMGIAYPSDQPLGENYSEVRLRPGPQLGVLDCMPPDV